MAKHNDFEWFRGEDIVLNGSEVTSTGTARDITGWTISCGIKRSLDDAAASLTIGATVTAPTSGSYTLAVSAANNTTVLSSGRWLYAIERTDTGSVAVLSEGAIQIKPSAKLA